jgi:hypothetical protein
MTDPYNPYPSLQSFALGARVMVAATCAGWRQDCLGVVVSTAEKVETVQGEEHLYWVKFDTPQHDLSDDGPYDRAQVLSRCLNAA